LAGSIGKEVVVCGRVAATRLDERQALELDLGRPAPSQMATVFIGRPRPFGEGFAGRALGRRVCARGVVERAPAGFRVALESDIRFLWTDEPPTPRPPGFGAGARDLLTDTAVVGLRPARDLPRPAYPQTAVRAMRSGGAQVEAVIKADGTIGDVRLAQSVDALWGLDEAALAAVRLVRLTPATVDGTPVDVITRFLVEFISTDTYQEASVTPFLGYGLGKEPSDMVANSSVTGLRPIRSPSPKYTSSAMRRKIQGTVGLAAVVRADGSVQVLGVLRSLDPFGLDVEAIRCAEAWFFEPGRINGVPVATRVTLELSFRLH
jgi:TonB family protein